MEISYDTKYKVNSYLRKVIKHKQYTGYIYFRTFLEIYYEKYKQTGFIPALKIPALLKYTSLTITPQSCQTSIKQFFKIENIEGNVLNNLIIFTESIIEENQAQLIEEDEY
jgi:hypothetical protein